MLRHLKFISLSFYIFISALTALNAEQFVLFDKTFTYETKDAIPTKSHLKIPASQFGKNTPKDWTSPVNYRNGTVYIRFEILEMPNSKVPTKWSVCYIPNKGQKNNYGCASSLMYKEPGVYENIVDMNKFWENDSIIWNKGIKMMTLVIKHAQKGGKGHAHLQPDLSKFFPTKLRVTMVQVSEGSEYNPSKVANLKK